jgi:DHA3 family macrolide efflux protein-like MFS transporter
MTTINQSKQTTMGHPDERMVKSYLVFWSGQLISLLGSSIAQFVIIWWITITYERALYLAVAAFLGFGSMLLTSLVAGVYVDRWNRKKIIGVADTLEVVATMVLIYLFATNNASMISILVVLTLRGVFQGFHAPAVQAIIPMMVPKEKLTRINGLDYLANGSVALLGPIIAVVLLGTLGLDSIDRILWIDAVTYGIAVIPLIMIKIPTLVKNNQDDATKSFREEFNEGVTFIKQTKGLMSLMSIFPTANFFLLPLTVLLPLIVIDKALFAGNEKTFATALVVSQIAFVLAALVMSTKKIFKKNTTGVALGIFLWIIGTLIIGIGAVLRIDLLLWVGMFVNGLTIPITNVSSQTMWQVVVPPELQGRVFVVRRSFGEGTYPISLVLTGFIAELIAPIVLVLIAALIELVILSHIWFFTSFQQVEEIIDTNASDMLSVRKTPLKTEDNYRIDPFTN